MALRMLGVFLETEEADRIFLQTDKDGDRRVSRSDFCALYKSELEKLRGIGAIAGNAFASVDDEDDDYINMDGFAEALLLLNVELSPNEVDKCFEKADVIKCGRLPQKQFVDFYDAELFWSYS